MEFHEIDTKGPFWVQRVTSNPSPWSSSYEGRIIYNTTTQLLYYGSNTAWITASNMFGPGSSTDSYIPQWNGTGGNTLKAGVMLDTDTSLTANSDSRIATQKAVKAYRDTHSNASSNVHGVAGSVVGTTDTQPLSNKTITSSTLTSPTVNTSISGTAIDNDTALAADSSTKVPTQHAVKTYVDSLNTTISAAIAAHAALTNDVHGVGAASNVVGTATTQTLSNKTLTSPTINTATISSPTISAPIINTSISGTAIDNSTTLGTSTTKVPTQYAIKTYVDGKVIPSGTKMWFFQPNVPLYWTPLSDTYNDALIGVRGGTGYFNVAGGNQVGTWDQGTHTHTYDHYHGISGQVLTTDQIPSHNHYMYMYYGFGDGGGQWYLSPYTNMDGNVCPPLPSTPPYNATTPYQYVSSTGGGGSHNHGGATGWSSSVGYYITSGSGTASTYRPKTNVGVLGSKD